jgi:uncharacterized CHY-type Zn-finger protein
MMTPLVNGMPLPEGYQVRLSGRCPVCHRRLKTDESISAGIGPVCRSKFVKSCK